MFLGRFVVSIAMFLLVVPSSVFGQQVQSGEPTASLPLEEVLRLYREIDKTKAEEPVSPPIEACVDSITLEGRLLDRSIEVTATAAVSILEDDEWVVVPLFRNLGSMNLVELPDLEHGTLTVIDGDLALVARKSGALEFDLTLTKNAKSEGALRSVTIEVAETTVAVLRLGFDSSSFRLRSPAAQVRGDEGMMFAASNQFTVEWERRGDVIQKTAKDEEVVPPAEPVVTRAVASLVSTLEGERILRVLYELRMQGSHDLRCALSEEMTLKRVFLNGLPVPFAIEHGALQLEVSPKKSGGDTGTLELLISGEPAAYHLAGDLMFTVPTVSWSVHELFMTLHLPDVFNYTWSSGSLEPAAAPSSAPFAHSMPEPGKELNFHQYLLSDSMPRLTLAYAVDLEGRYFRP